MDLTDPALIGLVYGTVVGTGLIFVNNKSRQMRWVLWGLIFVSFLYTLPLVVGVSFLIAGWFVLEAIFSLLAATTPPPEEDK
jgi:hypothetical protein